MKASQVGRPIEILMVEDNRSDVRLTVECLKELRFQYRVNVVENGLEAMAYLRREGKYSAAARPCVILLDLNLPLKDGRETLREIKGDPALRDIPVIVLTSSESERDISMVYSSYGNCYIAKPADLDDYVRVVRSIEDFWSDTAQVLCN